MRLVTRSWWLTILGLVLLGSITPGRADPPRGGDVVLFDRGSELGGTSAALFSIDVAMGLVQPISYVTQLQTPHGNSWGPGKRLYVGDASRIWVVDGYGDPEELPRAIQHRYLFAVADIVHTTDDRIFVLDQFADPLEEGYSGAVLELDPVTEDVTLIASDPRFVAPVSMVAEASGTLLVLDPYGRLTLGGPPVGAVYRVDPAAHTVIGLFSLQFLAAGTRPIAIALKDANTLLLADADATLPNHPPLGGAVYLVSLLTHEPIGLIQNDQFRDPSDLVVTADRRLVVLDASANPLGDPTAKGALFVFDLTNNLLLSTIARTYFRVLDSACLFDSPDLDNSTLSLVDVNGGSVHPGETLRWEAALMNTGPRAAGRVTLTAQTNALDCLFGSAVADTGEFAFDEGASRLRWEGYVAEGDTVHLAVDLRVPDGTPAGTHVTVPVRLESETIGLDREVSAMVGFSPEPGQAVYVDAGVTFPAPRLFTLAPDSWTPVGLFNDASLMPAPTDAVFGLDGTLYVLNASPARILAVDLETITATVLHEGSPLMRPSGICLARDGSLLIADPNLTSPINVPGAVYRFDPVTRQISTFYSEADPNLLRDPVDISPDRDGHYLVADYQSKASGTDVGALFEIDRDGHRVGQPYSAGAIMSDPFSVVVTPEAAAYITDIAPGAASVIRLRRPAGQPASFERIAGPNDTMLVRPFGIEQTGTNRFMICDGDNNPSGPSIGTLTRFELVGEGRWRLTFETYHSDLRTPRRAAYYRPPEPACAAIDVVDENHGRLMPGDTLEARAVLTNRSATPAIGVGAVLSYPSLLHPVSATTPSGSALIDEAFGTVHWSGDLAFLETDTLAVRFWIDSLAVQGDVTELAVRTVGGLESEPFTVRDTISAPLRGGEWIVLDRQANPFGTRSHGGFYTIDTEAGTLTPFLYHPALVKPADVYVDGTSRLLVVDSEADPFGVGGTTGAVFAIDPWLNSLRVFSASARYERPQRILPDPRGGWLVLDAMASECPSPAFGAVFHLPPGGGEPELVCCDARFRKLVDMAFDDQGLLWVADPYANPHGLPGAPGALFSIDLATGNVVDVYSTEELHDPTGLLWAPGRGLLFTDPAYRDNFGNSVIRSYDPATGNVEVVLSSPYLRTPTRLSTESGRRIWVIDSTAVPPGSALTGAIAEADLTDQLVLRYIQSSTARRLQAITRVPVPRPAIARFAADEDVGGHWHAKDDTVHCSLLLVNESSTGEPSASLAVTLSPNVVLNPATLRASSGTLGAGEDGFAWQGALGAMDSITIRYAAALTLPPGTSPYAEQRAVLHVPFGASDSTRLEHYVSNVTGDRELIVVDTRANPRNLPTGTGALFRIEGPVREAVPIIADSLFASPVAAQLLPGSQTELLVVDADARLPGSTLGGCLFRASTTTGIVRPIYVHSSFVEPIAVVALDEHVAYLLDQKADPLNLRPGGGDDGPGAIYRIDLDAGTGEVLVSDTLFVSPVDMTWDPSTGDLYVIDRDATIGGGGFVGGVFRVNPGTRQVTPYWVGAPFRSPRAGALGPDGKILVADFRELIGTATYLVDGSLGASLYSVCGDGETPHDLLLEPEGTLLITDATYSPPGVAEPAGSVLRNSRTGNLCRVFKTGAPLERPAGMAVYYAPTPAEDLDVTLTQTPDGVEVAWTVLPEDGDGDYYLYRRATGDGDEHPYEALNPRRPVRGPGPVTYLDDGLEENGRYEYLVVGVFADGSRHEYGPFEIDVQFVAAAFFLAAPSPNPWTVRSGAAGMVVRFGVPRRGTEVRLALIDVTGRCVRELWKGRAREAVETVAWDGRDASGSPLSSGIYFLRLDAGGRVANRRVILVR